MRKVFLKFVLLLCLICGIFCTTAVPSKAEEPEKLEVIYGEHYIYIKFLIDEKVIVFVYTYEYKLINIYPDGCGGPYGGN